MARDSTQNNTSNSNTIEKLSLKAPLLKSNAFGHPNLTVSSFSHFSQYLTISAEKPGRSKLKISENFKSRDSTSSGFHGNLNFLNRCEIEKQFSKLNRINQTESDFERKQRGKTRVQSSRTSHSKGREASKKRKTD